MNIKNRFSFIYLLFFGVFSAQQIIYIKDSLTKEKLNDVQVIVNNRVYYTNDDGAVLLPKTDSEIQITNSTYVSKKIKNFQDTVYLSPLYKDIPEVILKKNVDVIVCRLPQKQYNLKV